MSPKRSHWSPEALRQQIELGEDSQFELKEAFFEKGRVTAPRKERVANELAAFANARGGTLVFSVADDGSVRDLSRQQLDALEEYVANICESRIDPPLPFLTRRLHMTGGQAVLVVEVERSTLVHRSPGGYLTRKGSSVRSLSPPALQRLFQHRGRSGLRGPDLTLVEGTGPGTLDRELVDRFLGSRTMAPDDVQLQKLKLLMPDPTGELQATVSGVLLCTARPDEHLRGAVIEAVRYDGNLLGEARQLDAATIRGPLDAQIRDATQFVRRNTWVAARKDPGRVETPQFHARAVFEGIVNAVLHRDYGMEDRKIRLFVFDDRIELYSPGALPNSLEIESMRLQQATRNETLASLLRRLSVEGIFGSGDRQRFLEERGEGVPTIYERTRQLTGRDPDFELIGGTELRLTIPSARRPSDEFEGRVTVTASRKPLAKALVLAQYPNDTWLLERTDTFGRATFSFHSELPMTVFCAAPGHRAEVVRDWRATAELSVDLEPLREGGSVVFTEGTGQLPGLQGRLNPILDDLDRMYVYATNIGIDGGKRHPVHFKLGQNLRMTDVRGFRLMVRFVDMAGRSALVEYWPTP